jgi:hypothetical protein
MADHHSGYIFLTELETRDPEFRRKCLLWRHQTQREFAELIAKTRDSVVESQDLMAQADRLLAQKIS